MVAPVATHTSLHYLLPGILHALGNSIFAAEGHANLLEGESTDADSKAMIITAVREARQALDVLRCLASDDGDLTPVTDELLESLLKFLRIPLRDQGLRLQLDQGASDPGCHVSGPLFCNCLVAAVQSIATRVPEGCRLSISLRCSVEESGHVAMVLHSVNAPGFLPFPLDLASVTTEIAFCGAIDVSAGSESVKIILPSG